MSADPDTEPLGLHTLNVTDVVPNVRNPRLDFPQDELDRLAESIDQEGILVPIVVYPKDGKYVLVDGERRFRCALELGLETVPAQVTEERSEHDTLLQMFNIHLIREPWRDIPTARALQRLVEMTKDASGTDPTDAELRDLTGLSIERVRQLRYVVDLPEEWQLYIRKGNIPLNFFWELKKNVIDPLATWRPDLLVELGEDEIMTSLVQKRLNKIITDTVSLRKILPVIKFAAQDAMENGTGKSVFDDAIRDLVMNPDTRVDDVYDDTVQVMVEVDKLERRSASMVAAFSRLLAQSSTDEEKSKIAMIGRKLLDDLRAALEGNPGQDSWAN